MLISLAVDFHTADVATRERFQLSPTRVGELAGFLRAHGVEEIVHVGTCNRSELYLWCPHANSESAHEWMSLIVGLWTHANDDANGLHQHVSMRTGADAARHALRVAAGLESQVLGDAQILGQMRRAHVAAAESGTSGPVLHRLFEIALRAGKRVQATTALSGGTNSIGAQAASLARRHLESFANARVVVVGCGKTGERAARQFVKLGARNIVLLNRSPERAQRLGDELGVSSACMATLYGQVAVADVAVIATDAPEPLVHAEPLAVARADAGTRTSLLLIDLAMPRNVEARVAELQGVTVANLDAIQPAITATEIARRSKVPAAEVVVEAELQDFTDWLLAASAREAVRPLREALATACERELAFAISEEAAARLASRIVAKVMAAPMQTLRSALERGEPVADVASSVHLLFSQPENRVIAK